MCPFIVKQENTFPILVLQHPDEVSHAVGTAKLINLSLHRSDILIGTVFSDMQIFERLSVFGARNPLLIYPTAFNNGVDHYVYDFEKERFIGSPLKKNFDSLLLLDGTWRNTRELVLLNPWLKELASLHLLNAPETNYRIRQAKKGGALATIEAAGLGLRLLGDGLDEKALLLPFEKMIAFQIEKMGSETYAANYQNKKNA